MILLQQEYCSTNSKRQSELDYAKNCNKIIFSKIRTIKTAHRTTYRDLFDLAFNEHKNEICIIANNDIIFNNTIHLASGILEDNMIVALTRWDNEFFPSMEGTIGFDNSLCSHSQDVWIFKSGTLNKFDNNFCLGIPKCDNRLLFEAISSGIKVINPSLDIKTIHHHDSGIRTWTQKDAYDGDLFFPKITTIKAKCTDGLMIKENKKFYIKGNNMSIEEFFQNNTVEEDFDDVFYKNQYPETNEFYQPHCEINGISERKRLYFHYFQYGINNNYEPNAHNYLKNHVTGLDFKSIGKDIETFWPVAKAYEQKYATASSLGKEILKNKKIAVVALARNCDKKLEDSINRILSLNCQEFKLFIYENDSEDRTKDILNNIKHPDIHVSINNHNIEYLQGLGRERTIALANYRNICRNWVENNYSECDYVIVLDLDPDLGFSVDGIYNSIYWLNNIDDAGGMASYSLYLRYNKQSVEFVHYDSFAARLNDWEPTINDDVNNKWFRNLHPLVGSNPIPMYSCFGGLAVYKKEAFLSGHYDGSIGSEHVLFHQCLRDKGYNMYLNPSSRFFSVYEKRDIV